MKKKRPANEIKAGMYIALNGGFERVVWSGPGTGERAHKWLLQWAWGGVWTKPTTECMSLLPNARFWVWECDGWVKITLKPGQTLSYGGGGPTDEGYSWFHQEWEYDESWPCIFSRYSNGGSDCDGPHEYHAESACRLENLSAVPPRIADPEYQLDEIPFPRPDWVQCVRGQRDFYAEAAGY